jgi:peptide/nickel transport system ATP-binding protein
VSETILQVKNLKKIFQVKASAFSTKKLPLKAVDGVSFDLKKGETLGVVGESGCGKTTVGRTILRLYDPDAGRAFLFPDEKVVPEVDELDRQADELERRADEVMAEGSQEEAPKAEELRKKAAQLRKQANAQAEGIDVFSMPKQTLLKNRRHMQMVFQDPWASLNPRMLVRELISEGPREYGTHRGKAAEKLVYEMLDLVGLPRNVVNRYPHEFSGGQRQRIGIARALALHPSVVVCDEAVSALDVSIQAQILNLLVKVQREFQLTYMFIAHDLSVVRYISDRIAVMYLGKIVESGSSGEVYHRPRHPYTISLISSVPVPDPEANQDEIVLEGDVPSPVNPPSGCTFHPRCPYRIERCSREIPQLRDDGSGHAIACFNPPHG